MLTEDERREIRNLNHVFTHIPEHLSLRGVTWGSDIFKRIVSKAEEDE